MDIILDIPDTEEILSRLTVMQLVDGETLSLPVAGKRTDGKPGYAQLFLRDGLTSADLRQDWPMMRSFLLFGASQQGRRPNAVTAEEAGKFPHEVSGVTIGRRGGRNTLFCACDTTPLALIAAHKYVEATGDIETIRRILPEMIAAFGYVRAHLCDGLFMESPNFSDFSSNRNKDFALEATYWRDGGIPGRPERQLVYPASFLLQQAMVVAALRAYFSLARNDWFPVTAHYVGSVEAELRSAREAFRFAFDQTNKDGSWEEPPVAIDATGPIHFAATDAAHALHYLEPDEVSDAYRSYCVATLQKLETPWGWKTWAFDPAIPGMNFLEEQEQERIWPYEQAFIRMGLERHGSEDAGDVAFRAARHLIVSGVPYSEFFTLHALREEADPTPGGCDIHLWPIAYWAWVKRRMQTTSA